MTYDATDAALMDALPSFVSIAPMMKATPRTEGDRRFIYVEASNETVDQQGEIVLAKALEDSADYFSKFGNLDLEHYSIIGAKAGIKDHESYEIGLPVEVRVDNGATFVKGEIYAGTGRMADKANLFWSSLTEVSPAKRWYTSVGGAVMGKAISTDPETGTRVAVINKVRWSNLAFSATPVNPNLRPASLAPFGPLAKSWGAAGLDVLKALTGAQRGEQGDEKPMTYAEFRDCLAHCIGTGVIDASDKKDLVREAGSRFGLSSADAARNVERFLDDLKRGITEPV